MELSRRQICHNYRTLSSFGTSSFLLSYGGHNAIPHNDLWISREVSSFTYPLLPYSKRSDIRTLRSVQQRNFYPYIAEPGVYHHWQCPRLYLCFAIVCYQTAGRSLSRGRIHEIFGSHAASNRNQLPTGMTLFTSFPRLLSGLQWCPRYYAGFTL